MAKTRGPRSARTSRFNSDIGGHYVSFNLLKALPQESHMVGRYYAASPGDFVEIGLYSRKVPRRARVQLDGTSLVEQKVSQKIRRLKWWCALNYKARFLVGICFLPLEYRRGILLRFHQVYEGTLSGVAVFKNQFW